MSLTWLGFCSLLRKPETVQPDLALHQGFLEPTPEPSPAPCWSWPASTKASPKRNPDLALHQSPDLALHLTWLCTKASRNTANLFSLRSGAACERWPVTSRIRIELPVNHVDEPERSHQPSLKITCFTKHPGLSVWRRGERANAQIVAQCLSSSERLLHPLGHVGSTTLSFERRRPVPIKNNERSLNCSPWAARSRWQVRRWTRFGLRLGFWLGLCHNCRLWSSLRLRRPLALHQNLTDLLGNLLRNPVEPDLALHQSLPDLLRNILRNPVEPDLALHQSLPDFRNLWNFLRNLVLTRRLHQCTPELFWVEDPISLRCWGKSMPLAVPLCERPCKNSPRTGGAVVGCWGTACRDFFRVATVKPCWLLIPLWGLRTTVINLGQLLAT